ncbi:MULTISPECIES: hypothetical protein [unclassified Nocardiopsis]|uniref:hypothetical protein n=1 Tax=unclassified Nocardiopsis TaxID=2649073 RepID=UPI00093B1212|nr:hypothetical protein [Nocardiopsis sp. TSRI0078]
MNRTVACALTAATAVVGGVLPFAPAAVGAATVNLHTLICYETEDWGADGDELYLVVDGRRIWSSADSVDCDHDSPARVPVNRKASTGTEVFLYEADSPDGDDLLGSDVIEGDRGTLVFNNDNALYNLDYGPA